MPNHENNKNNIIPYLNIIKTTKILYLKLIIVYKTFGDSEADLIHHHVTS